MRYVSNEDKGLSIINFPEMRKGEVLMPAKGFWGGARRGIVVGARLPVLVGFVSSIFVLMALLIYRFFTERLIKGNV